MGIYENSYFITNRGKTLAETISNISTSVENIYILVGFFYFSGFFRLKDEFKDKNIKILIGLDIEKKLGKFFIEYQIIKEGENISEKDLKKKTYNSFVQMFSYSDFFDNPQVKESFNLFVNKIKDGTIELRKTKEPNHAKLYIFENKKDFSQNGDYPGTVITGSSNLSLKGLEKRFEIDVISREKAHYNEAKKIFDELWKNSVPIASKENFDEFKENVLNKIWPTYELPTPYEVYIRVLDEYFKANEPVIRIPKDINRNFINLQYQNDAIKFAIETIKKHNGVIIADVVGLGKSIIASAIAHNLNLDTIIITPPHLKDQWEAYRIKFKFMGNVYSTGKIEDALKDYAKEPQRKLIIVDEAHRFRNTDTINYHLLWLLCQGNYVALLTATPFNNSPEDIESLLKLFTPLRKSTLKHIDDLSLEFKTLIKKYKELKKSAKNLQKQQIKQQADEIAKRIRYIISPITIRRTRVDLMKIEKYKKDLEKQGIVFPKVNPPDIIPYSFGSLDELYLETIEKFIEDNNQNNFTAARYKPILYINDEDYKAEIAVKYTGHKTKKEALQFIEISQTNLSSLIKRIFVKRFESSFGSFAKTLDDFIESHQKIKEYYEKKGKVPIYKKFDQIPSISELEEMNDTERMESLKKLEELTNNEEIIWIEKDKLSNQFIKDIDNDIKILEGIKKDWAKYISNINYDYKFQKLLEILKQKIKNNEKVIIFSEYSDTVNYLYENLKEKFRVISYTSASKENLREEVEKNFDASISENFQKNDYDILITTDVLSEGINLHRANNIINYDIPYNPTRIIQRIGRVNRVSKLKLKDIFIYNFFPSKIGETHTHIKNISTLKMHMIHFLLGEDAQYLTQEEEIRSFFEQMYENSSYFEEESWDVKYRSFLYEVEDKNPEILRKAGTIPLRTKIQRKIEKEIKIENSQHKKPIYLIFAKKGENFIFKSGFLINNSLEIKTLTDEDAIKLFEADINEKSYEVSNDFYEKYTKIKENIFETSTILIRDGRDKWKDVLNKLIVLEKDLKDNFEYSNYISKLKEVIELENLPDYILKIIKEVEFNSIEDLEKLKEKLPEFYIDKVLSNINEMDSKDDVIIISEEIV